MSIITPLAILSYPHVFEPDEKGKYSAALVFPEGTDLTALRRAAFGVVVEKFGEAKAKEMLKTGAYRLQGGPHHSIRTDVAAKGYPEGTVGFINARSDRAPGIVTTIPDPETGKPMPLTDRSALYPGAIVRADVNPYWYSVDGNQGVAWGLNNLQKVRDGERLDGRVAAEDVFEADEDAVADLSDLTDAGAQEDVDPAELAGAGAAADEGGDLDLSDLL